MTSPGQGPLEEASHSLPTDLSEQPITLQLGWGRWLEKNPHLPLPDPKPARADTPAEAATRREGPCAGRKAFLSRSEPASGFALPLPRTIPTFTAKELLQTHTRAHVFLEEGGKFQENLCSVKNEVKIILRMKGERGRSAHTEGPFIAPGRAPRAAANTNAGGTEPAGPSAALPGRVPADLGLAPLPFPLC